jgi:hypothetical protein
MATAWSFAIDEEEALAETLADARAEAERLGRRIVGEPSVRRVPGEHGESVWWVTVFVERATSAD